VRGKNWDFTSQKRPFVIVTAVKTSNLTYGTNLIQNIYIIDRGREMTA
jgi:hypothetical protein